MTNPYAVLNTLSRRDPSGQEDRLAVLTEKMRKRFKERDWWDLGCSDPNRGYRVDAVGDGTFTVTWAPPIFTDIEGFTTHPYPNFEAALRGAVVDFDQRWRNDLGYCCPERLKQLPYHRVVTNKDQA